MRAVKVAYTNRTNVGARNCYTVVYVYLVVASLMDPCVQTHIGGTDGETNYMVLPDHFEALLLDAVDRIITYCIEH